MRKRTDTVSPFASSRMGDKHPSMESRKLIGQGMSRRWRRGTCALSNPRMLAFQCPPPHRLPAARLLPWSRHPSASRSRPRLQAGCCCCSIWWDGKDSYFFFWEGGGSHWQQTPLRTWWGVPAVVEREPEHFPVTSAVGGEGGQQQTGKCAGHNLLLVKKVADILPNHRCRFEGRKEVVVGGAKPSDPPLTDHGPTDGWGDTRNGALGTMSGGTMGGGGRAEPSQRLLVWVASDPVPAFSQFAIPPAF